MISAVLNHLWQSTLFALAAGLLTLALRRRGAGLRHGLWLAASIKYLVPFALLAAIGERLPPSRPAMLSAVPQNLLIEEAAQPFPQPVPITALAPTTHVAQPFDLAPILVALWAAGSALVLTLWLWRWLRVQRIVRAAAPLDWPGPAPIRASGALLEPVLVGIWRPVLLIPEHLPQQLQPAQVEAILAHEFCHLRRRDNLTAAVHMLVEVLFWFYPLVWWIGGRLIAERERACDEAVIRAGHDREAYARGIIETCRLYLQSPLPCMAGASGSNLQNRVEAIMTASLPTPLPLAAKALLGVAGALALASPVTAGMLAAPPAGQSQATPVKLASPLPVPVPQAAQAVAGPQPSEPPKPIALAQAQTQVAAPVSSAAASPATAASLPKDDVARLRAEQQQPRQVASFDPTRFDRYVGYYELGPTAVFQITRVGDKFFSQLTGQGPVELFPESETKFFATVVAAQISFTLDPQGRATGLVLHQNGREQPAPRIDEAKAASLAAALDQRIASHTPSPGTEAFLQRYLESDEAGSADYSGMAPDLAQLARAQQERFANDIKIWGPLLSIQFGGVTPLGADRYTVTFKNAQVPVVVVPLNADGKVPGLLFTQPIAGSPASPETAQRVKDNRPSPGTEASVRKWLASLVAGQPDYGDMTASLAQAARQQWPQTSQQIKAFGALKDVRFVRVTAHGEDVYEADFDHNRIQVSVAPLGADGKVWSRNWQVLP
jgi:beta-lactamase regulating signal transducer with metallopeptidase domain